jgi:transcriptional regulator with XRE-family HTH domain
MNTVLLNKPHKGIGVILKAYREKTGLNQAEIAKKAHISTSMLSQIERSVVSPSIDTLFSVCNALGLDITHLFRSISDKQQVRVLHKGERLKNTSDGIQYEQLVVNVDAAFPAELFLLEIAPCQKVGLSENGHEGTEMGYVLYGTALLVVDGKEYILKEGDSVVFNASLPHGLENTGTEPFKAVWNALPPHKDYLEID